MIEKTQLEDILNFYKCPCNVTGTRTGGGFCDYYLQPVNGTTINKLQARVNDFTVAIGQAVSIAIENMTLIFRVKDANNQPVYNFFEYLNNLDPVEGMLSIGINPAGEYVQYNLFDMPHLLVAGATGSGKSVFLHNAIISLSQSENIIFTLIDLKRVELSIYNGLNFLDGDVVTDAIEAEERLSLEVAEMSARYKLMEQYNARNYKDLPKEHALKARVIVIDELADLMLNRETRRSVENSIVRLAQLGRAAGMHLIIATQRPSTAVITGLIKANIPCKISFMVSNSVDARVVGCKGAETLNGRGDALLSIAGKKELERVQGFNVPNEYLRGFVEMVKHNQSKAEPKPPTQTQPQKRGFIKRLFG